MIGKIILLPFRLVGRLLGMGFTIVKLLGGLVIGILRFVFSRLFGTIFGVVVGLLLGKKYLTIKRGTGKRPATTTAPKKS